MEADRNRKVIMVEPLTNEQHIFAYNVSNITDSPEAGLNQFGTTIGPLDDQIWTPDVIQRVASLVVIMVITLIGNTIIIIVLTCSKYKKKNSRVNIFIINLAIGDLTVCFATMTTEILFVCFGEWVLGPAACKILPYLQIVTLASTTFILTAMSYDRFMAICNPLNFRNTIHQARISIAAAWIMAFGFAVPQLFIFVQTIKGVHPNGKKKYGCQTHGYTGEWQRKVYFTFLTTYILIIPAILISYFYINVVLAVWRASREIVNTAGEGTLRRSVPNRSTIPRAKIKTIKMTLSIITTFIACWTPYFVVNLIRIYSNYKYDIPATVIAFAETMALLQSGLNPLVYGFFNIKLKRGLMEVFCPHKIPRLNRNQSLRTVLPTECVSVAEDFKSSRSSVRSGREYHLVNQTNNVPTPTGDRQRNQSSIITEENTNGYRLRVRFTPKETTHPADSKHGEENTLEEDLQPSTECETTKV
ncbi:gonadotropin-releasing hormone II receptor-like [Octopus vulgaris]|uniref:Gonadotropin-releasing hormone II receptor-like n=2 Tax=Octopus TaxID=6643 RepID=A0AA36F934_OCTVU|nr:gonadotropin-releasing hormone II receptor-like [Octopus sinensis]XP_036363346.1 gonadotropin-releasing hormone II receptor-like [Octopus sinensis]XP_036363347.1 gonadotropin-releasing hormone II receptor-like [Octopus sinensis]XP_036363348.1 gonadotropin-releasing hormone II receptor-like [Octopus sinensis]XP_036363349.1 gonadotropin-releasing hormone II receptor-like [Octopus sinensis]XP_036363351.1 gonadotropin-releasing hormone II receptor-like [Octopus sinensis]CAI9730341.1 gonadotrop